jgi:hypothetical protein
MSPSIVGSMRARVDFWWSERHHSTDRLTMITFGTSSRPRTAARVERASGSSSSLRRAR